MRVDQIFDIKTKVLLIGLVPLLSGILVLGTLWSAINALERAEAKENEARRILFILSSMSRRAVKDVSLLAAYGRYRDRNVLQVVLSDKPGLRSDLEALTKIASSRPELKSAVGDMVTRGFDTLAEFEKIFPTAEGTDYTANIMHYQLAATQISASISDASSLRIHFSKEIQKLATRTQSAKSAVWSLLFYVLPLSLVSSTFLVLLLSRSISQRLQLLCENSTRLARGMELKEPLAGNDELAAVDRSFREMAFSIRDILERERAMVDNAAAVICSLNPDLSFKHVSQAAKRAWRLEPSAIVGRHLSELVDDSIPTFPDNSKSGAEFTFETSHLTPDGAKIFHWSSKWSEEEQTYYCVARDVTNERKTQQILQRIDEELRLIIASVPAAVLVANDSLHVLFANKSAERLTGMSKESLERCTLDQFLQPGSFALIQERISTLLPANTAPDHAAYLEIQQFSRDRILDSSNRSVDVEIHAALFVYESAPSVLITMLDASQQAALSAIRQEVLSTLNERSLTMLQLSAELNAIADRTTTITERGRRRLLNASSQAERLRRLFDELLMVESNQLETMQLKRTECSVLSLFEHSVEATAPKALKAAIKIEVMTPSHQITLFVDADRITQVLVNLLSNAIKFSPPGSSIRLGAQALSDKVKLTVSDEGRGIPEGMEKSIFGSYRQVDAADALEKGGSGLGLSICKTIAELHGGTMSVHNNEGPGCTFTLDLPLSKTENI